MDLMDLKDIIITQYEEIQTAKSIIKTLNLRLGCWSKEDKMARIIKERRDNWEREAELLKEEIELYKEMLREEESNAKN